MCRISGPAYFYLFAGFAANVHSCTALLLILLDVIAELRIHERTFARQAVFLHIFYPEKLFVDPVTEQLLLDVVEVGQLLTRRNFTGTEGNSFSAMTVSVLVSPNGQKSCNSLARFRTRFTVVFGALLLTAMLCWLRSKPASLITSRYLVMI